MAFVVRRRGGRFEIRESVHTEQGPRSRSLANLSRLTEAVLARAEGRATRPFDRGSVVASALRAGVPIDDVTRGGTAVPRSPRPLQDYVGAARRFASLADDGHPERHEDPGATLVQLLRFADEVRRHSPRRPELVALPVLARAGRGSDTS